MVVNMLDMSCHIIRVEEAFTTNRTLIVSFSGMRFHTAKNKTMGISC